MLKALELNDYEFPVATDLDYYGPEANESDVEDYEEFAAEYLSKFANETVTTYSVDQYSRNEPEGMKELRQKVWDAYCNR